MSTQALMLLLEIIAVLLLLTEVFIRVRRRRQDKKESVAARARPRGLAPEDTPKTAPTPVGGPTATLEPEVSQSTLSLTDLLEEAHVYIQYGHYAQAATVLRWYVDLNPHDARVVGELLDVYLAMDDLESYTALLESLGEESPHTDFDITWWKLRIADGLSADSGNLELLALAEKLGVPVPMPNENSMAGVTAEMALMLVSRNADPYYGKSVLWNALRLNPEKLAVYAELLRIDRQQGWLEDYIDVLICLFLAVGTAAPSLRTRMLRVGMSLGPSPEWAVFERWNGQREVLKELARSRKLELPQSLLEAHR